MIERNDMYIDINTQKEIKTMTERQDKYNKEFKTKKERQIMIERQEKYSKEITTQRERERENEKDNNRKVR